jgi:hypothetical protein
MQAQHSLDDEERDLLQEIETGGREREVPDLFFVIVATALEGCNQGRRQQHGNKCNSNNDVTHSAQPPGGENLSLATPFYWCLQRHF